MRTDRLQTLPGVIGVAAASVDPAIAEILAELTGLEQQLEELDAEAHDLERQLEASTHQALDAVTALPLLERVFAEHEARVRDELRAALEQAVGDADRLLAAARVEADAILVRSAAGGPVSSGPAVPTAAAREFVDPRASASPIARLETEPKPTPVAEPAPAPEPAPRDLDWTIVRPEPATANPFRAETTTAPTVVLVGSAQEASTPRPVHAEPEPVAFGQFWDAQHGSPEPRNLRPTIMDAVLPLLAVAIVVVVVLSWMG